MSVVTKERQYSPTKQILPLPGIALPVESPKTIHSTELPQTTPARDVILQIKGAAPLAQREAAVQTVIPTSPDALIMNAFGLLGPYPDLPSASASPSLQNSDSAPLPTQPTLPSNSQALDALIMSTFGLSPSLPEALPVSETHTHSGAQLQSESTQQHTSELNSPSLDDLIMGAFGLSSSPDQQNTPVRESPNLPDLPAPQQYTSFPRESEVALNTDSEEIMENFVLVLPQIQEEYNSYYANLAGSLADISDPFQIAVAYNEAAANRHFDDDGKPHLYLNLKYLVQRPGEQTEEVREKVLQEQERFQVRTLEQIVHNVGYIAENPQERQSPRYDENGTPIQQSTAVIEGCANIVVGHDENGEFLIVHAHGGESKEFILESAVKTLYFLKREAESAHDGMLLTPTNPEEIELRQQQLLFLHIAVSAVAGLEITQQYAQALQNLSPQATDVEKLQILEQQLVVHHALLNDEEFKENKIFLLKAGSPLEEAHTNTEQETVPEISGLYDTAIVQLVLYADILTQRIQDTDQNREGQPNPLANIMNEKIFGDISLETVPSAEDLAFAKSETGRILEQLKLARAAHPDLQPNILSLLLAQMHDPSIKTVSLDLNMVSLMNISNLDKGKINRALKGNMPILRLTVENKKLADVSKTDVIRILASAQEIKSRLDSTPLTQEEQTILTLAKLINNAEIYYVYADVQNHGQFAHGKYKRIRKGEGFVAVLDPCPSHANRIIAASKELQSTATQLTQQLTQLKQATSLSAGPGKPAKQNAVEAIGPFQGPRQISDYATILKNRLRLQPTLQAAQQLARNIIGLPETLRAGKTESPASISSQKKRTSASQTRAPKLQSGEKKRTLLPLPKRKAGDTALQTVKTYYYKEKSDKARKKLAPKYAVFTADRSKATYVIADSRAAIASEKPGNTQSVTKREQYPLAAALILPDASDQVRLKAVRAHIAAAASFTIRTNTAHTPVVRHSPGEASMRQTASRNYPGSPIIYGSLSRVTRVTQAPPAPRVHSTPDRAPHQLSFGVRIQRGYSNASRMLEQRLGRSNPRATEVRFAATPAERPKNKRIIRRIGKAAGSNDYQTSLGRSSSNPEQGDIVQIITTAPAHPHLLRNRTNPPSRNVDSSTEISSSTTTRQNTGIDSRNPTVDSGPTAPPTNPSVLNPGDAQQSYTASPAPIEITRETGEGLRTTLQNAATQNAIETLTDSAETTAKEAQGANHIFEKPQVRSSDTRGNSEDRKKKKRNAAQVRQAEVTGGQRVRPIEGTELSGVELLGNVPSAETRNHNTEEEISAPSREILTTPPATDQSSQATATGEGNTIAGSSPPPANDPADDQTSKIRSLTDAKYQRSAGQNYAAATTTNEFSVTNPQGFRTGVYTSVAKFERQNKAAA